MSLVRTQTRGRVSSALPGSNAEKTTRRLNPVCDVIEITDSGSDDDKCSVIELTDSSDNEDAPTKKDVLKVGPRKQPAPTAYTKKHFHKVRPRKQSAATVPIKKQFHKVRPRKRSALTSTDEARLNPPKGDQLIGPQAEGKTVSAMLAQVLELAPDVQPRLARDLILRHFTVGQNQVLEAVIQSLFEPTSGRRVEKRNSTEQGQLEGGGHKRPRLGEVDYSRVDRNQKGGPDYQGLCMVRAIHLRLWCVC